MSSMPLCAAHHPMPDFNGDAIAQYMRTDFITLPDHLSVNGAREYFVSQLTTDDIPGQVFVVAGKALRGVLSIKRLLQEKGKRAARTVLTGRCYSVGNATRQGSSSLTRFIGQSAMTSRT